MGRGKLLEVVVDISLCLEHVQVFLCELYLATHHALRQIVDGPELKVVGKQQYV